jgi:hypothetical protein
MRARRGEGGRGLLVVLVALAIVAFLARDALTAYLGGATRAAGGNGSQTAPERDSAAAPRDPGMQRPVERARGVEDAVARGAAERARALEERGQ